MEVARGKNELAEVGCTVPTLIDVDFTMNCNCLAVIALFVVVVAAPQHVNSCPLDFSVLNGYSSALQAACNEGNNVTTCCQAAAAGVELSLAKYLKESNLFLLQNTTQARLCLRRLRAQMQLIGVHPDVVDQCSFGLEAINVTSEQRVSVLHWQPELCRGIQSVQDFQRVAGAVNLGPCSEANRLECQVCSNNMRSVQDKLESNGTVNCVECSNFVRMYVLAQEPTGDRAQTALCLYALAPNSSPPEAPRQLYLGIGVSATVVVCGVLVSVLLWSWWRRRESAIHREFLVRNNRC